MAGLGIIPLAFAAAVREEAGAIILAEETTADGTTEGLETI
jgi:hypothetical protein